MEDLMFVLIMEGEKLPTKRALNELFKEVEIHFASSLEITDGKAFKEFLKERYKIGFPYALRKQGAAYGWQLIRDNLKEIPLIDGRIHVYLVTQGERTSTGAEDVSTNQILTKMYELCKRLEKGVFVSLWSTFWGDISSSSTIENTVLFRKSLVEYYGDDEDKNNVADANKPLRCMVTNLRLPGEWITAAHLFARKDRSKAFLLGINDIDDPRNGMLWNRAIEEAFSLFKIIFSWDEDRETLLIHIIDEKLRDEKLSNMKLRKPFNRSQDLFMKEEMKDQFDRLKFGDLDGKPLEFKNLNRPFKRALSMHAMLGIHKARMEGTLHEDSDLQKYKFEYWSESADKQLLNTFLRGSLSWTEARRNDEDADDDIDINLERLSSKS